MGYSPPHLEVRKVAGGWNVYGPSSTSGDDLFIYPNTVDDYAKVRILGSGALCLDTTNSFQFNKAGVDILYLSYNSPDLEFQGAVADKNIYLNPIGTGKVKFGTFTSDITVTQDGYITILDSGGTTRYLSCITP